VVTEVGGWLSHAAILARELGVPGIVGVTNATRALQTGDLVRLHQDGTVEVSQRNRREELRYPLNREVTLRWGHLFAPGRLLNISRNGALMRVGAKVLADLAPASIAHVILLPDDTDMEFTVMRHAEDCLGVRFSDKLPAELIKRLRGTTLEEEVTKVRAAEGRLLKATLEVHYEEEFETLLQKILATTTSLMEADRSSLFIFDEASNELLSVVAEGTGGRQIRFPSHLGIAGAVFTNGDLINIPDAYKDPRFNPDVDKATGYRTRSLIACPVTSLGKRPLGVIQVLNKLDGTFTAEDEKILRQYAEQAAIALQNARHRQGGRPAAEAISGSCPRAAWACRL
jgi:signal transduction protein with GAF and PtsI domain